MNARDTTLAFVSRAPQAKIQGLKGTHGAGDPSPGHPHRLTDALTSASKSGWHERFIPVTATASSAPTSSTAAATKAMGSTWSYLDITALGRQEEWERLAGGLPADPPYRWWNYHTTRTEMPREAMSDESRACCGRQSSSSRMRSEDRAPDGWRGSGLAEAGTPRIRGTTAARGGMPGTRGADSRLYVTGSGRCCGGGSPGKPGNAQLFLARLQETRGGSRQAASGRRAATARPRAVRAIALVQLQERFERPRVVIHVRPRIAVHRDRAGKRRDRGESSSGCTTSASSHRRGVETCPPGQARTHQAPNTVL